MSLISDTNSSFTSDELDEVVLYHLEDESTRTTTPLPTFDFCDDNKVFTTFIENETSLLMFAPPTLSDPERPETSSSSITSFVIETIQTPLPAECLQLPTFVVPEKMSSLDSSDALDNKRYAQFNKWLFECEPRGDFVSMSTEELAKNPRVIRSTPDVPSLFKRRDQGCGYCRSIGYPYWQTHTRSNCNNLRALAPCKICGAHGELNHTETYCPVKPSVILPLENKFVQSSVNGRFERCRRHFYKYGELINSIYSSSD